jgi:hypothetical protein
VYFFDIYIWQSFQGQNLLLQVSVELPSLDIGAGALRDCYAPAMHWADVFWLTCLSK